MNLRQMEVFRAIMREGTITDAAKFLGVSQPSVTEVLRFTEGKLGFRLFDRFKGRLRATSEAHILFDEAEQIFELVQVFRRSCDGLRDTQIGSLNIATISALGLALVPSLLGPFMAERTQLRARLLVKRRFDLMEAIATEGIDVGFAFLAANDPRVIRRELLRAGLICIFPKRHPLQRRKRITIGDLADYPLVSYTPTQGLSAIINSAFTEAGVATHPVVEVEDIAQAWSVVQAGIGVAVVDPFSKLSGMFPNVIARPLESRISLSLDALLPRRKPASGVTEAFLAHVKCCLLQAPASE